MSVSLPAHYRQGTFSFILTEVETLISYKLQSYDQPDDSRTWMWHAINLSCSPRVIFPPKYNWISTWITHGGCCNPYSHTSKPQHFLEDHYQKEFYRSLYYLVDGKFLYILQETRVAGQSTSSSPVQNGRWKWNWWAHEKISTWRQILSPVSHEPNGGLCAVEFHPGKCERPGMFFGIPFFGSWCVIQKPLRRKQAALSCPVFPRILEKRRFLTPASRRSWISLWVKGETLCITDDVPVLSRACF